MKTSCNIIQDLLPQYHDGVCSDETRELVEEHLKECKDCRGILAEIGKDISPVRKGLETAPEQELSALKKAWDKNAKKSFRQGILRGWIALVSVLVVVVAVLFMPVPHHYDITFTDVYTFSGDPAEVTVRVDCWNLTSLAGYQVKASVTVTDASGSEADTYDYVSDYSLKSMDARSRRYRRQHGFTFPYNKLEGRQIDFMAGSGEGFVQEGFLVWTEDLQNILLFTENEHYLATSENLDFTELSSAFSGYAEFIWTESE